MSCIVVRVLVPVVGPNGDVCWAPAVLCYPVGNFYSLILMQCYCALVLAITARVLVRFNVVLVEQAIGSRCQWRSSCPLSFVSLSHGHFWRSELSCCRLHCKHCVTVLHIPRCEGSLSALRIMRVLIRGAEVVFAVVPVVLVVAVYLLLVPLPRLQCRRRTRVSHCSLRGPFRYCLHCVAVFPGNTFPAWTCTSMCTWLRKNFPVWKYIQFVYVVWCLVNYDVWSLKFGCCFVVFCVFPHVLDLVHLWANLQFRGVLGFVGRVRVMLSAVLCSDLRLLSHERQLFCGNFCTLCRPFMRRQ